MKTAFEISQGPLFDIATKQSGILRVEFEREIQQIQLDAMKEGVLREKKQFFEPSPRRHMESERDMVLRNLNMYRKAILTTSNNWTIKDLTVS